MVVKLDAGNELIVGGCCQCISMHNVIDIDEAHHVDKWGLHSSRTDGLGVQDRLLLVQDRLGVQEDLSRIIYVLNKYQYSKPIYVIL